MPCSRRPARRSARRRTSNPTGPWPDLISRYADRRSIDLPVAQRSRWLDVGRPQGPLPARDARPAGWQWRGDAGLRDQPGRSQSLPRAQPRNRRALSAVEGRRGRRGAHRDRQPARDERGGVPLLLRPDRPQHAAAGADHVDLHHRQQRRCRRRLQLGRGAVPAGAGQHWRQPGPAATAIVQCGGRGVERVPRQQCHGPGRLAVRSARRRARSGGGVLGSAGTTTVHGNFPNAIFPNTWYHQALANKLRGADSNGAEPDLGCHVQQRRRHRLPGRRHALLLRPRQRHAGRHDQPLRGAAARDRPRHRLLQLHGRGHGRVLQRVPGCVGPLPVRPRPGPDLVQHAQRRGPRGLGDQQQRPAVGRSERAHRLGLPDPGSRRRDRARRALHAGDAASPAPRSRTTTRGRRRTC